MEVEAVVVVVGWGGKGDERSHLHAVKNKTKTKKIKTVRFQRAIKRPGESPAMKAMKVLRPRWPKLHLILEECLPGAYSNRT